MLFSTNSYIRLLDLGMRIPHTLGETTAHHRCQGYSFIHSLKPQNVSGIMLSGITDREPHVCSSRFSFLTKYMLHFPVRAVRADSLSEAQALIESPLKWIFPGVVHCSHKQHPLETSQLSKLGHGNTFPKTNSLSAVIKICVICRFKLQL